MSKTTRLNLGLLILAFLPTTGWGQICTEIGAFWWGPHPSLCTGQPIVTVLDAIHQIEGNCPCPGELQVTQTFLDKAELMYPRSVIVSPGGDHLYLGSNDLDESGILVYRRNSATGQLDFLEAHYHSVQNQDGLDKPLAMAFSADGHHLYVGGRYGVAFLERSPTTGHLTYRELISGTNELSQVEALTLSPDGQTLYAANRDSIAVFQRAGDGALTMLEEHYQGVNGVSGLDLVSSMEISPDGMFLYATGRLSDSIAIFQRDPGTGALSFTEAVLDGVDGVDGLDSARKATLDPSGTFLYAIGFSDKALAVFRRDAVTGSLQFLEIHRQRENGVEGLLFVEELAMSVDGAFLYTGSDQQGGAVAVFARDAVSGLLSFVEYYQEEPGFSSLSAPYTMTVSPENNHLFIAGDPSDNLGIFQMDPSQGGLTFIGHPNHGDPIDGLAGASAALLSPAGEHLYVLGKAEAAIAIFNREATTGDLSYNGLFQDPNQTESGSQLLHKMIVSPDGNHLYAVGANFEDALMVFSRDGDTGMLTLVHGLSAGSVLNDPTIAISPDGNQVYTASKQGHAVGHFQRDQVQGSLNFMEAFEDGSGGVTGIRGNSDIIVSGDGLNVYTTGDLDHSIAVFQRTPATGDLTFFEAYFDGLHGVEGIGGGKSLALSPDGNHVYHTGSLENTVAVFRRDETYGTLIFLTHYQNGEAGVAGLSSPQKIAVHPDGSRVYVTGSEDNAIAVLERDAATGLLTFIKAVVHQVPVATALEGPRGFTVSSDGRRLYLAGSDFSAVSSLVVTPIP